MDARFKINYVSEDIESTFQARLTDEITYFWIITSSTVMID